jgi:hypothetical protein
MMRTSTLAHIPQLFQTVPVGAFPDIEPARNLAVTEPAVARRFPIGSRWPVFRLARRRMQVSNRGTHSAHYEGFCHEEALLYRR